MTVPAEPVTVGIPNQEEHVDAQDGTSASQFALALKPFAVLVLMIKNTYSLSDSTLKLLLLTMVMLIRIVGVAFKIDNSNIQAFVEVFPTTEYQLRSLTSCSEKGFFQIICCPKCRKLYDVMNKWTIYAHSKEADFLCDHVKFPEHAPSPIKTQEMCLNVIAKSFYWIGICLQAIEGVPLQRTAFTSGQYSSKV